MIVYNYEDYLAHGQIKALIRESLLLRDAVAYYLDHSPVSAKTLKNYRSVAERHIFPLYGDMRLIDYTYLDFQTHLGHIYLIAGPSARTTVKAIIGNTFRLFSLFQLVPGDISKGYRTERATRHMPVPLKDHEIREFLRLTDGHRFRNLFLCMLFLGIRPGEVYALSFDDWDEAAGTLRVCSVLDNVTHNRVPTRITRTIYVPTSLRYIPAEERARQEEARRTTSVRWRNPEKLIFTMPDGRCISSSTVRNDLKKISASIPSVQHDITQKNLFETALSILLDSGCDVKSLQVIPGVSCAKTVLSGLSTAGGSLIRKEMENLFADYMLNQLNKMKEVHEKWRIIQAETNPEL